MCCNYLCKSQTCSYRENYAPKRAGNINKETQFALEKFGVKEPEYVGDVRTQVSDIDLRKIDPIKKGASIKTAYSRMKNENASLLVVTNDDNYLEGVISVSDIAASGFDVYDNRIFQRQKLHLKILPKHLKQRYWLETQTAFSITARYLLPQTALTFLETILKKTTLQFSATVLKHSFLL